MEFFPNLDVFEHILKQIYSYIIRVEYFQLFANTARACRQTGQGRLHIFLEGAKLEKTFKETCLQNKTT